MTNDGLYGKISVRREQADGTKYINIDIDLKGATEGSITGDMLLKPDDTVMVERNKTYFIRLLHQMKKLSIFLLFTSFLGYSQAGGEEVFAGLRCWSRQDSDIDRRGTCAEDLGGLGSKDLGLQRNETKQDGPTAYGRLSLVHETALSRWRFPFQLRR